MFTKLILFNSRIRLKVFNLNLIGLDIKINRTSLVKLHTNKLTDL
jgi:hypothetical protein